MNEPIFRRATRTDVPRIVEMLADDRLGGQREDFRLPLSTEYYEAFEQINQDANHELIVAEADGMVIGTLHLIFLSSLSYRGGLQAQIESVRVDAKFRNQGLGTKMMEYATQRTKARGAHIVQLISDKSRVNAHRFYERLGFSASHVGMKKNLE